MLVESSVWVCRYFLAVLPVPKYIKLSKFDRQQTGSVIYFPRSGRATSYFLSLGAFDLFLLIYGSIYFSCSGPTFNPSLISSADKHARGIIRDESGASRSRPAMGQFRLLTDGMVFMNFWAFSKIPSCRFINVLIECRITKEN